MKHKHAINKKISEIHDSNEIETICCPYCRSSQFIKYRMQNDIVKCLQCDTVYLRTRIKKTVMEQLYQSYNDDAPQMFLPQNEDEIKNSVLRRDYWMKEILQYIEPKGNILDIGCGWGAFLDNARSYGFNPTGVEITRNGAKYALEKLNIKVTSNQFLDTQYELESFQLVTMNHVLEHLPEPKEAIDKIADILSPGGMFCGIVPNIESLCSKYLKDSWEWLDANYHYVHYSPNTVKRHLENAGFIVEKLYTISGDFNYKEMKNVIQKYYRPLNENKIKEIIKQLEIRGEGEEVRFIAKKPQKQFVERSKAKSSFYEKHSRRTHNEYIVSIIIPVFNKVEFTQQCLDALYSVNSGISSFEVIIVDNASTDQSKEYLEFAIQFFPDLKVITCHENLKFAKACNIGASLAEGHYFVFLNNDTVPQEGWLVEGINPFKSDKEIGIVGCKLIYPNHTIQHAGIELIEGIHPEYPLWPIHRMVGFYENDPMVCIPEYVDAITGACLFIESNLYNSLRGFSEEYGMYFEDTDLCFKVKSVGKKIFYQPTSVVIHYEGKSNPNISMRHSQNRGAAVIFFSKWKDTIDDMLKRNVSWNKNIPEIEMSVGTMSNETKEYFLNILLKKGAMKEAEKIIGELILSKPEDKILKGKLNYIKYFSDINNETIQLAPITSMSLTKTHVNKDIITLIIVTFNNLSYTKELLDSLSKSTDRDYKLIIVDNASTDGTVEYLRSIKDKNGLIDVIYNKNNEGFPKAINQAFSYVDSRYYVILNNDIVVTEGWLNRMIDAAESDSCIGIVGPMSNHVSGIQKVEEVKYNNIAEMHEFAARQRIKNEGIKLQFPRVAFLCTLIKGEVIRKIGGLDERFSPGNYEDDDYCLRAQLAGFKTIVATDVFIHHYGSKSFTADGNEKYLERLKINEKIFIEKWGATPDEIWIKGKNILKRNIVYPINNDRFIRHFERALIYLEEKEISFALFELEQAKNSYYDSDKKGYEKVEYPDLLNLIGTTYLLSENLESAKDNFEEELKIIPTSSRACMGLGDVFAAMGSYDSAKVMYEWAVKNDSCNKDALSRLETVNLQLGLPKNDNSLIGESEVIENEYFEGNLKKAEDFISEGRYYEAKDILLENLSKYPGSVEILNNLTIIEILTENYTVALNFIEEAIKIQPGNPVLLDNLKYIQEKLKNYKTL